MTDTTDFREIRYSFLKNIPTKELLEELIQREGVEETIAEPYQDVTITVSGPARVLVIKD